LCIIRLPSSRRHPNCLRYLGQGEQRPITAGSNGASDPALIISGVVTIRSFVCGAGMRAHILASAHSPKTDL